MLELKGIVISSIKVQRIVLSTLIYLLFLSSFFKSSFRPPALLCFNSAQIQFSIASSIVFQFSSQPLTVSLSFSHCSLHVLLLFPYYYHLYYFFLYLLVLRATMHRRCCPFSLGHCIHHIIPSMSNAISVCMSIAISVSIAISASFSVHRISHRSYFISTHRMVGLRFLLESIKPHRMG